MTWPLIVAGENGDDFLSSRLRASRNERLPLCRVGCPREAWLRGEGISVLGILCLRRKVTSAAGNMGKGLVREIRVTDRDV